MSGFQTVTCVPRAARFLFTMGVGSVDRQSAEDHMQRTLFGVLLACAAPALALGAPPAPVYGVYLVDFNVRLGAALPAGALVTCKVKIVPDAPAPGQSQLPPSQSVTGVASVSGSTAHCAVELPFAWAAADARRAATLSYEIDAETPAGPQTVVRATVGQGVGLPQLPPGGAARMNFSLTL